MPLWEAMWAHSQLTCLSANKLKTQAIITVYTNITVDSQTHSMDTIHMHSNKVFIVSHCYTLWYRRQAQTILQFDRNFAGLSTGRLTILISNGAVRSAVLYCYWVLQLFFFMSLGLKGMDKACIVRRLAEIGGYSLNLLPTIWWLQRGHALQSVAKHFKHFSREVAVARSNSTVLPETISCCSKGQAGCFKEQHNS